ncbi:hypothetical protein MT349_16125 [Rathayibacter caricis]|uniref:hypothetical protein n=1 Tax=Rathayibacter caricis TaxID=110936 RepID=UPI001FB43E9A|nr:hypothetical protein [Rathayibacter caricis]MCJ1697312.1 hypothetical protein [Rathayibacter caricis]
MRRTTAGIALAGALLLALTGCAGGGGTVGEVSTPKPIPTLTPTAAAPAAPVATAQLGEPELAAVFTGIQFVPDQYASIQEMLDSIYPGLTATDASCLSPFGLGWDTASPGSTVQYGTSNDRSMTSVVASAADPTAASALVADAKGALERCASGSTLFAMEGVPVQTTVAQTVPATTGTDESVGWTVTGAVGSSPFTLVGITARIGGNVVALVGWDPATNASYVPQATQIFVDAL